MRDEVKAAGTQPLLLLCSLSFPFTQQDLGAGQMRLLLSLRTPASPSLAVQFLRR